MDNELRCLLHSHYPFSIIHYPLSKLFFQKLPRIACSASGYFFRCTYRYDISAFVSAFRSEVDYIIGTFDNIHIMFDDDNAVSPSDECVEGIQQFADAPLCNYCLSRAVYGDDNLYFLYHHICFCALCFLGDFASSVLWVTGTV